MEFIKNNWFKISLLAISLIGVVSYISKTEFPIEYVICDSNYEDCKTYALFDSMYDCQIHQEKGGWLCDSSNPLNIKCKVGDDSIATSYCK